LKLLKYREVPKGNQGMEGQESSQKRHQNWRFGLEKKKELGEPWETS
jgi:hypothetical protein